MRTLILAAALLATPALGQEQPTTAPTVEVEHYGVRSEKTGEMTSVRVIRRYPPQPPAQTNVYILPPPVYRYGGYGRYRR